MNNNKSTRRGLTTFSLVMLTVLSVDSLRNLPSTAIFGSSLIFFFAIATVFFLLPCTLVAAELSSAYPKTGGVYVWVKEAFSSRIGFLAIWFQWIENVIWYPTILSFVAGVIGFLINPALASSKVFLISVVLVVFWTATLINMFGMRSSAWFSNFCAIFGLLLPMLFIIGLGLMWIVFGHPLQIHFSYHDMLPDFSHPGMWTALTGVVLSFCGMEIATVHGGEVNNPRKAFPRALLIAVVILLVTLTLGALSIAISVPVAKMSLVAGMMQSFSIFLDSYHVHWLLPVVAVTLVIGSLGGVSNWIIAPTKGLLVAGKDGYFPKHCLLENRYGAPYALLLYQAFIVTGLVFVFLLMPSVNASYWVLTVLSAQLYMLMYVFMFLAIIVLRHKNKTSQGVFQIPGGKVGMYVVALAGLLGVIATIFIGFVPPDNIKIGGVMHYEIILVSGLVLMSLPPFILYFSRKKKITG